MAPVVTAERLTKRFGELTVVDDLTFELAAGKTVLIGLVPGVGRFAPGNAGNALAGAGDSRLLSPAWGGALFVAYSVAFAALGWTLLARRDVG